MKAAPDPIYVQEFLFKQSDTYQILDGFPCIPAACNLLTADKKRGLLYIGHNNKITVLKPAEENCAEWRIEHQLPGVISKIAINCDDSYIAVAITLKPAILIYDVHSLVKNSLNILFEIGLNKVDNYMMDIRWNPTIPGMLCTVTSDYTISSFELKEEEGVKEKAVPKVCAQSKVSDGLEILCAAWSPKGKQVAVGCKNGNIIQLKPDLKIARTITGPSPSIGEVISLLWISNYQFCAAYLNSERHINVLIVDAPKGEANAMFTCYEDITYGFPDAEGEDSISRYYFEHVPEWGLIIAASSNSSEIAVLGTTNGGANWNQWQLVDNGRAQLPLMRTTEIFPVGIAVDRSPINRLPWGSDSTLTHPVPILHILGTSGKLCGFHMVNLMPNCPVINCAPTEIIAAPSSPSQPPTTLSTEMSFSMNAVTSTPYSKQPEIVSERSIPTPITNIFGDSLKAAGFFQQPVEQSVEQSKPQEERSTVAPVVGIAFKEAPPLEPTTTEVKLVVNKEINSSQSQIEERKTSIDDNVRIRAYFQELALFEKELRSRLEPQVWECGTDEERKRLGEVSVLMEQFLRDLKDTTNSLSSDVAHLEALLLQSFAWVEETKSKNAASIDTSRNCGENSKIANLQRCYYYTHTQLSQVSKILDLEWSEHKAQEMTKMKIPSLEFVYQNLLMHNKIIVKEKEKLEQISRKWKSLNRTSAYAISDVSFLNRSISNLHVSTPKSPMATIIRGKTDEIDARCKTIASKTLSFTHEKQIKLKALLSESPPRIIKPVNPSTIQDRLTTTLSSLASLNPAALAETKTKTEPVMVTKQSIFNQQTVEKTKVQSNPLASLNSIVARIGTVDTNNAIMQNKMQQKPLSTAASLPTAISIVQTEKKPTVSAVPLTSQPKLKQDLNVNFPSITFGTSSPKSQDTLFPKSPVADTITKNGKELMRNDITVSKAPESALFSTGPLKDVLLTEYSLTKPEEIGRNLPTLSATSVTKTDAAATFSFAMPNVGPSVVKNSSATTPALDAMMSFSYSKLVHTSPVVEPSTTTVQPPMQTSVDLSALSLGSNPLTLQPTIDNNLPTDRKVNMVPASVNIPFVATTQAIAVTTVAPFTTTIGSLTISLGQSGNTTGVTRKPEETLVSNSVVIEKIPVPEVKVSSSFGAMASQAPTSISAPIFGGQAMMKNTLAVSGASVTLPATTVFGMVAFPSITSTLGTATSVSTASVFSGFSNMPTTAGSSVSPFQSSLSKTTFGEVATSTSATSFGITSSNNSANTISFGVPTMTTTTTTTAMATATSTAAASITPVFGKSPIASPTSNVQFQSAQTPASSTNVFGKPIISPASTPFSNTTNAAFSSIPAASTSTSIFGNNSNMNSIFGSMPLSSTSGNIFGGNSTGFSIAPSGSIFNNSASKPGNIFGGTTNAAAASPFGSTTSSASPVGASAAGTNVFKSTVTNTSPIGIGTQQPVLSNQPMFGQAPAFGAKPVFGSPPTMFGASKPVFGSSFGSPPTFESSSIGFGGSPAMQSGSTIENVMPKVFGEVAGSSTFESLATQSGGLSFGSLAQKNPESEKPAFTAGSSFSSWR